MKNRVIAALIIFIAGAFMPLSNPSAAESPEQKQWQERMEKAYAVALSQFTDTPHAQFESMEDYERFMKRRKLLEEAQAGWSAYRAANCAFYEAARSDLTCALRMTKERTLELEALSKTP